MTAPQRQTAAVRGQGYMRRDDGMLLPFNPDIWNGDQRTKKRWVRVAEMPADYVEAQNELRRQEGEREGALLAARELAEERKAIAKAEQAAAAKRARKTPIKITDAMRQAQALADSQQKPAELVISEMSKDQLMEVASNTYHTPLDPSLSLEDMQLAFAKLAGAEVT